MTKREFERALDLAIRSEDHCDFQALLVLVDSVYRQVGLGMSPFRERTFFLLTEATSTISVLKARWLALEYMHGFDDDGDDDSAVGARLLPPRGPVVVEMEALITKLA